MLLVFVTIIRSPRFSGPIHERFVGGSGIEPASSEAKRAGRMGVHHTTGLLDSQAALSLVDLFSWVSRCIQAVSSSELQEVMASSHVFDRAFGRSVVLSFAGVSMARLRWRSQ